MPFSAVGYARWAGRVHEPLRLTLKELAAYMRGVGLPTYQYALIAAAALAAPPTQAQTAWSSAAGSSP